MMKAFIRTILILLILANIALASEKTKVTVDFVSKTLKIMSQEHILNNKVYYKIFIGSDIGAKKTDIEFSLSFDGKNIHTFKLKDSPIYDPKSEDKIEHCQWYALFPKENNFPPKAHLQHNQPRGSILIRLSVGFSSKTGIKKY
jgi:hypothetical protein